MENLPKEAGAVINYSDPKMIATLKATVAQGATDEEFAMFAGLCQSTGLNPFKKEVWFIKTKSYRKKDGTMSEPKVQIMTGINGFLAVANSHPQFDGIECDVEYGKDGLPVKAVAKVWRKDRKFPSKAEALWSEYYKPNPYGNKGIWEQMPSVMIAKCAKSLALREAFPQELNGLYTQEEMPAEYGPPPEMQGIKAAPVNGHAAPAPKAAAVRPDMTNRVRYSLEKMRKAELTQEEKRQLYAEAMGKGKAIHEGDYLYTMQPLTMLAPYLDVELTPADNLRAVEAASDQGGYVLIDDDEEPVYNPNFSFEENANAVNESIKKKQRRAA